MTTIYFPYYATIEGTEGITYDLIKRVDKDATISSERIDIIFGSFLVAMNKTADDYYQIVTVNSDINYDEMDETFVGGIPLTIYRINAEWFIVYNTNVFEETVIFFFQGRRLQAGRIGYKWYMQF